MEKNEQISLRNSLWEYIAQKIENYTSLALFPVLPKYYDLFMYVLPQQA